MNILFNEEENNNYNHEILNNIFFIEHENNILYFLNDNFLFEQQKPIIKDINLFKTKILDFLKKNKNKISIYYLTFLFDIPKNDNIEYLYNFNRLNINSKIDIEFLINNNKIIFFIKEQEILKCEINELKIILESKILIKIQNDLKLKCKEILFVLDDTNFKNSINVKELDVKLFKNSYWLYYSKDYTFQSFLNMIMYYDIILFTSSSSSHLFELIFKNSNYLLHLKNKQFILLRTSFNFDLPSGYKNIENIESNNITNKSKLYFARKYIGLKELIEKLKKMNNQIFFICPPIFNTDNIMKNVALPIHKKNFDVFKNYNFCKPHELYNFLYNNGGQHLIEDMLKNEDLLFNYIYIKNDKIFPYVNEIKNKFANYLKTNNYIETNNNISYSNSSPYPTSNTICKFKYFFTSIFSLEKGTVLLPNIIYNKETFCKINNLNNKNKIITFFIGWPNKSTTCNIDLFKYDNSFKQRFGFESLFYQNEKFIELLKILKSLKYNIIIKCHPSDILKIVNNEIFFMNNETPLYSKYINKIKKYSIFIDNLYSNEIYKYTDYGIIFSATTISYYNYLYNFPVLGISTKNVKYDWFIYQSTLLSDIFFGEKHYLEDIENNLKEILNNFFNYDKNKFKYYSNHPFYGNAYNNMLDINTNIIIETINKKQKFIEESYLCNIFNKCYDTKNIQYIINVTEIIMKIQNKPTTSYGISIFNNLKKGRYKLTFDAKINEYQDKKYFMKIYTGNKWIILDKELDENFNNFEIIADFNFFKTSLWRISSTIDFINASVTIKKVSFY